MVAWVGAVTLAIWQLMPFVRIVRKFWLVVRELLLWLAFPAIRVRHVLLSDGLLGLLIPCERLLLVLKASSASGQFFLSGPVPSTPTHVRWPCPGCVVSDPHPCVRCPSPLRNSSDPWLTVVRTLLWNQDWRRVHYLSAPQPCICMRLACGPG